MDRTGAVPEWVGVSLQKKERKVPRMPPKSLASRIFTGTQMMGGSPLSTVWGMAAEASVETAASHLSQPPLHTRAKPSQGKQLEVTTSGGIWKWGSCQGVLQCFWSYHVLGETEEETEERS